MHGLFQLIINNEEHKFGISCDYHNIWIVGFQKGIYTIAVHAFFQYGEQSSPCQVVYSNSQVKSNQNLDATIFLYEII